MFTIAPNEIFTDNTLLTAATRALRSRPGELTDFDFLALVELTQSYVCYERVILDGSSRRGWDDTAKWDQATTPFAHLQKHATRLISFQDSPGMNVDKELYRAATFSLQDAAEGRYLKTYQASCLEAGVGSLVPNSYYRDQGIDDALFNQAEATLTKLGFDLSQAQSGTLPRALARYVFRGYYYQGVAQRFHASYTPCELRGRLLRESRLFLQPGALDKERLNWARARIEAAGASEELQGILEDLGLQLLTGYQEQKERDPIRLPMTFLHVLRMCEDNRSMTIPEAVSRLRTQEEGIRFREYMGVFLKELRASSLDPNRLVALREATEEIKHYITVFEHSIGVTQASISLLPLVGLVSKVAVDSIRVVLDMLGPHAKGILTAQLPKEAFTPFCLKPHFLLLYEIFKEKAAMRSAREGFEEYLKTRGPAD